MNTTKIKENPQAFCNDRANKTDSYFLSTISILADKYHIQADINPETRQVNFTGGSDHDQQALAQDIANTLQRYAT